MIISKFSDYFSVYLAYELSIPMVELLVWQCSESDWVGI